MPATLLLADDNVTTRRVMELTFADEDVRVVSVGDGDEAIAHLDRTPPDILLADVGMRGKSGYDLARHVKTTPKLAHIPVVLLTGAFEPIDRARAEQAGCDGVLAKPFEPQLVVTRVRELLAKHRGGEAPRADPSGERPRTALDEYFEQLDAAFANLAQTSGARKGAPLPVSFASPIEAFQHEDALPPAASGPAEAAPPAAPAPHLFASESPAAAPAPAGAVERLEPAPPATPPTVAPALDDRAIELIARAVVERLSEGPLREIVRDAIAAAAERLVREEIERIRGDVK
ncbi:MAG TPA: response regulator [Vicinamibacterales bacterium]|nr:response regulator [Vicinamibacterales bacterium]